MTDLSREILDRWQVRHTRAQKTAFIEFLQEKLPELRVEKGSFRCRNLVLGDLENAKVVFGAHYDTCAVLPFPNFLMPEHPVLSLLYGVLPVIPMSFLSGILVYLADLFSPNIFFYEAALLFPYLFLIWLMLFGFPNKHTANDNTSGVVTVLELYASLSDEQRKNAAFVLFDNEELGLIGSSEFHRAHKAEMVEKLLINADCVSDGDDLLLILNKRAFPRYEKAFLAAFSETGNKRVAVKSKKGIYYPSDQENFPVSVGAAAFKKGRLGLYLDRIHTARDTVFDEDNISLLVFGFTNLLEHL